MLKGRYLNPKYARRRRRCRIAVIVVAAVTVTLWTGLSILLIDSNIRATMLPAAPAAAQLERSDYDSYTVTILGRSFSFSVKWAVAMRHQLGALLHTPPAPVRFFYQARGFITDSIPRNLRSDPKIKAPV